MKLYPALLALILAASPGAASAQQAAPATPAAPAARLTTILAPTGQALLFDTIRGEYVVVRAGDTFQGFRVGAIGAGQIVLSTTGPSPHHFVLQVAGASAPAAPTAGQSGAAKAIELKPNDDAPIDPYAKPGVTPAAPAAPIDPYAGLPPDAPVSSTPIDPFAGKPASTGPTDDAPIDPFAAEPAPAPPAQPAPIDPFTGKPRVADPVASRKVSLRRAELDDALADFTVIASEVQLAVEGEKVRIIDLSRGSFFHRLGLRRGDLIVSVDGDPVHDVDRAAAVYARLKRANQFEIKLYRGTQRMKIAVELKR